MRQVHNNLFQGYPQGEVYEVLEQHLNRDIRKANLYGVLFLLCMGAGVYGIGDSDLFWLFGGMLFLCLMIIVNQDIGNRNHLMHMIDWHNNRWGEQENE